MTKSKYKYTVKSYGPMAQTLYMTQPNLAQARHEVKMIEKAFDSEIRTATILRRKR